MCWSINEVTTSGSDRGVQQRAEVAEERERDPASTIPQPGQDCNVIRPPHTSRLQPAPPSLLSPPFGSSCSDLRIAVTATSVQISDHPIQLSSIPIWSRRTRASPSCPLCPNAPLGSACSCCAFRAAAAAVIVAAIACVAWIPT
ncbi:hypothetical protein BDZ90DRAFT_50423 [Jaminaea rosea]|uniref:Uncharacterized protein n=1 Tax=Jaminaea rosea TaxID=1569628 RepID=A0A316UQW4_9BASI|nr:hypothetical protein BDZ90DRAFT_50423 [Jaminaea rosea]PWN26263.1 hypothetical protein BDZ90DRAFT_50423 [Jaminaea rosea]